MPHLMSRSRRFALSLGSGYLLMAANAIYSLASVPLALGYLSDEEFGLWALTTQIGQYIALIDAGMAGSISRIIVDYKDDREHPAYGSVIKTSLCVSAVQALLILLICVPLSPVLSAATGVPPGLRNSLTLLILWQSISLAASFLFRTPSLVLIAHQRLDLFNYVSTCGFAVTYLAMWAGFRYGHGVVSVIWGQLVAQVLVSAVCTWFCWRLRLQPKPGAWGSVSWLSFKELFGFARDMFLYTMGLQLINASQAVLVTRVMGLPQAAVWSVCTRTFNLASQIVSKVLDVACPAFAEMIAREETDRLHIRFRSICVLSASLCVWCGVTFSVCNHLFVLLWTKGRFEWPVLNDVLLSVWLLFTTLTRCHAGLIGLTKDFRFLRYCNFVQGALFVAVSLLVLRTGGISAMLGVAIAASIGIGFAYTTWRASKYLGIPWQEAALGWLKKPTEFCLLLLPVGFGVHWIIANHRSALALGFALALLGASGLILMAGTGLDPHLRLELVNRMPLKLRRLLFG